MKRKKELEEEILKLEYEMQVNDIKKTGQVKRVEAYCSYILTEYLIYRTIPPIFYLPVKHNDVTKKRLAQSIQRIEV